MATRTRVCPDCKYEMPITRTSCPHCGRPQFFPNVDIAESPEEKQKLHQRFQDAIVQCQNDSCWDVATRFISACEKSVAVFACPLLKLHRQVASGTDVFETYYDLERLRLRASSSKRFDWAKLRPQAEIELLGSHHHINQIHYACLSIDGTGLESYGDCTVALSEAMIAHRASCFEGNTAVVFAEKHHFSQFLRSGWTNRHRICFATCGRDLDSSCTESEFPGILVKVVGKPEDDWFIEVHVFGPMTAKTFEAVRVNVTRHSHREELLRDAVQQKLDGIRFEVIRS